MCGIVGVVTRGNAPSIGAALAAMRHRGPDANGTANINLSHGSAVLGHARLSILDLSADANQPFWSGARDQVLVFNGEIYNHDALRTRLRARGASFRTRSDTEVLLQACAHDWEAALPQLNGMFAFAALDVTRQRLLLARDPFGIKPLYYTEMPNGGIAFASEIQALAAATGRHFDVDPRMLGEFLRNGFLYDPDTGLTDVRKVPAGHFLQMDLRSFDYSLHPYAAAADANSHADFGDVLQQEMQLQIQADVPVGIFFSGGVDSSALAAAAPRGSAAFFVDYGDDSELSDSPYVDVTAQALGVALRRSSHRAAEGDADAVLAGFRQVARGTEEPISDYTYLSTYVISAAARDAGFKVMLSGMGADELFAGYPRQIAAARWHTAHALRAPISAAARLLARTSAWDKRASRLRSFANATTFAEAYTNLVGYFSTAEVDRMLGNSETSAPLLAKLQGILEPVRHRSLLQQAMHLDLLGYLQHNLTVVDRASMACSIELRVPFLTPDMSAHAQAQRDGDLVHGLRGKMPLRRFLRDRLPPHLINRPKIGFNPPLDGRINMLGADLLTSLLTRGPLAGYVDVVFARTLIDEHFTRRANHTYRLWQLVYLNYWLSAQTESTQQLRNVANGLA